MNMDALRKLIMMALIAGGGAGLMQGLEDINVDNIHNLFKNDTVAESVKALVGVSQKQEEYIIRHTGTVEQYYNGQGGDISKYYTDLKPQKR